MTIKNNLELYIKKSRNMKRIGIVLFLTLVGTVCAFSQQIPSLEEVIGDVANIIISRLPYGSTVVISGSQMGISELQEHAIRRLRRRLTTNDKITYKETNADYDIQVFIRLLGDIHRIEITARNIQNSEVPVSEDRDVSMNFYTAGAKVGYGALNLLFGTGSFIMGDIRRGIPLLVVQALGVGIFIYGIHEFYDDVDNYRRNYSGKISYDDYKKRDTSYYMRLYTSMGVGIGLVAITAGYGFYRPWAYDKARVKKANARAAFNPLSDIRIIPDDKGIGIRYSRSF